MKYLDKVEFKDRVHVKKMKKFTKEFGDINVDNCREILDYLNCGYSLPDLSKITGIKYSKLLYYRDLNKRRAASKKFRDNHKQKQYVEHTLRNYILAFKNKDRNNKYNYNLKDVLEYLGPSPQCYLSRQPIDIQQVTTYYFDHFVPISKGGTSELSNLRICLKGYSKWDLLFDDFILECKRIAEIHNINK